MRAEGILKRLISFSLLLSLLIWMGVCHVFGNPNAKHPVTNERLTADCFKARGQVTVDAELDEWKFVEPVEVKYKEQDIKGGRHWKNVEDCSGKIMLMWDESFIYVAAEIKDDKLVANKTGSSIWQNDGLEIFFAPDNEPSPLGGWPHPTHYQFGLAPSGPNDKPQSWAWCNVDGNANQAADYITIASKLLKPYTGYIIEASIKLEGTPALAEKVVEGDIIAFHCTIDDADGNAEPESQMTWSGLDPHDENGFGSLTFVGPASVSPRGKLGITWGWLKR
jgi:hypothetical protein